MMMLQISTVAGLKSCIWCCCTYTKWIYSIQFYVCWIRIYCFKGGGG